MNVDFSLFESNIYCIVSHMFYRFKKDIEDTNKVIDHDNKRNLISLYDKVWNGLKHKEFQNDNGLDCLLQSTDVIELNININKIIDLQFKGDLNITTSNIESIGKFSGLNLKISK